MTASTRHETVLELVRERPALVPDLLAKLDVSLPPFTEARLGDSALHEPAPVEHFADAVVLLALEERPVLGVIVEAQLRRDDQKLYSWPQYAMNARARHKCPFLVMVATPSPSVARWACAAIRGISELPEEQQLLYSTMVRNALSAALREELEKMVDIRKFMNTTERRNYDKAEARGEAKGKAEALLKVLAKRGLPLTASQRSQIAECTDLIALDRWFDQALTAASVDELLR